MKVKICAGEFKRIIDNTKRFVGDGTISALMRWIYPLGCCVDGDRVDIDKFGFGSCECGGRILYVRIPYNAGDILYVRETWHEYSKRVGKGETCRLETFYGYKASVRNSEDAAEKWKPSIHMPKETARIWLKIVDVRAERLQNMRPVDVINEGAYEDCWDCLDAYGESGFQCCYQKEDECSQCDSVMMEWERLWNSTIKKTDHDSYSWEVNPWVWVIEFERCEKPVEYSPW